MPEAVYEMVEDLPRILDDLNPWPDPAWQNSQRRLHVAQQAIWNVDGGIMSSIIPFIQAVSDWKVVFRRLDRLSALWDLRKEYWKVDKIVKSRCNERIPAFQDLKAFFTWHQRALGVASSHEYRCSKRHLNRGWKPLPQGTVKVNPFVA